MDEEKIILTQEEYAMLKKLAHNEFSIDGCTMEEAKVVNKLLSMASSWEFKLNAYEEVNNDNPACDITLWFLHKYEAQQRAAE
jgi:hypothetical protein